MAEQKLGALDFTTQGAGGEQTAAVGLLFRAGVQSASARSFVT